MKKKLLHMLLGAVTIIGCYSSVIATEINMVEDDAMIYATSEEIQPLENMDTYIEEDTVVIAPVEVEVSMGKKVVDYAKQFIGKECLVYSYDGHQLEGVIKEVGSGAILLEKNGEMEAVNLDFVMRIREYPKNKKGKKKSVVLD